MRSVQIFYEQFVNWVQGDMKKDRLVVNRKIFSVFLWCLFFPSLIFIVLFALRRYQWIGPMGNADTVVFFPPFVYAIYSLWPTIREIPKAFQKGGVSALLDESLKETEWREKTAQKMKADLKLTEQEWKITAFHLRSDLQRLSQRNRYMSILAGVVLFFMFQFFDLGSTADLPIDPNSANLARIWVEQFTQWGVQVFSLGLFSVLFYLSGLQFQFYLNRYLDCVERIIDSD